jgi:hypothetical protein
VVSNVQSTVACLHSLTDTTKPTEHCRTPNSSPLSTTDRLLWLLQLVSPFVSSSAFPYASHFLLPEPREPIVLIHKPGCWSPRAHFLPRTVHRSKELRMGQRNHGRSRVSRAFGAAAALLPDEFHEIHQSFSGQHVSSRHSPVKETVH